MTIAGRVIEIVGGPEVVSQITGVHISRVYSWTWPKSRGGAGGRIPSQHQQLILNYAVEKGLPLSPADFFDQVEKGAEPKAKPEAGKAKGQGHRPSGKPAPRSAQRESVRTNHAKRAGAGA